MKCVQMIQERKENKRLHRTESAEIREPEVRCARAEQRDPGRLLKAEKALACRVTNVYVPSPNMFFLPVDRWKVVSVNP